VTDNMGEKSAQGIGTGIEDATVVTSCGGCVFAEVVDSKQTGCELGRLDKFRSIGADIKEATNEQNEEFYVIRRLCNAYRNSEWGEYWKDKNKRLKKEVAIRTNFVVLLNEEHSISDLEHTCTEIALQDDFEASRVITINNSTKLDNFDIIHKLHEIYGGYSDQTAYMSKEQDGTTFTHAYMVNKSSEFNTCLKVAFQHMINGYYVVFHAGKDIPRDFVKRLDNMINKEMMQVLMIEPDGDSVDGLVMSVAMHKYMQTLYEKETIDIYATAKEMGEKQGFDHLFISWKDVPK
jgi:hypothetical protein